MANSLLCTNCAAFNRTGATHCIACGRKLDAAVETNPEGLNVML